MLYVIPMVTTKITIDYIQKSTRKESKHGHYKKKNTKEGSKRENKISNTYKTYRKQ